MLAAKYLGIQERMAGAAVEESRASVVQFFCNSELYNQARYIEVAARHIAYLLELCIVRRGSDTTVASA